MYTNQRGRVSKDTDFSGWITGRMNYEISSETSLEMGVGFIYQNGYLNNDYIDELYLDFQNSWIQVIAGRKQQKELYGGLSATNENMAWSLNARPLPGVRFHSLRPVYLNKKQSLGIEFSWEEYSMGADRYVKGTRLHTKRLYFISNLKKGWQLKLGIRHFAQWGGTSPRWGKQPTGFKDYLKIVAGREGGAESTPGDQINVIGSHLGTYELYLNKNFRKGELKIIYNHFFEDGSGSRFENFPDGRYGVFYSSEDDGSILKSIMYEFFYTKNQSQTAPYLFDYYFMNGVYASGWTYQNRVVGLPLLTTNYYEDYPPGIQNIRVGNNSIIAHHLGLAGKFLKKFPYKLLMTYRKNYGHYRNKGYEGYDYFPADDPRGLVKLDKNVFSTRLDIDIPFDFANLSLILGGDFSKSQNVIGTGLSLSKAF
ncbi:capsule assembly Wzi family protein [Gramella lutea]|uniref:Capsule assembly Wzi family protein n=1 Tax=Christiangramia lutea TaxID=1607951 RepID=A0A9X1V0D6_9FLAO|nr:capsule assembly Wzi family protein [Christiangramia lutea]MCH4821972.1 capsule assembly Wzi family protein [Christiangramia lutea]